MGGVTEPRGQQIPPGSLCRVGPPLASIIGLLLPSRGGVRVGY